MKKVSLLLISLITVSCMTHILVRHDDFEGYTKHWMIGNTLAGKKPIISPEDIDLNPQRFQAKDGTVIYSLIIEYMAKDWMFIKSGKSMVLLIDGKPLSLTSDGSVKYREILSGIGFVTEKAYYDIEPDDLRLIANASSVRVKIKGSKGFVERHFSKKNFSRFQEFVEKVM